MPRTLIVTNDFPPHKGGIESFVSALADRFGEDEVVVFTSNEVGAEKYDATLPYPVIRDKSHMLLPTRRIKRAAAEILRTYKCDRVLFGAAAPLGLMGDHLRKAGARRIVAITHGHEIWWARIPFTRQLLRVIASRVDILTYIATWCRDQERHALKSPELQAKQKRMPPGVDTSSYFPGCGGKELRARLGIEENAPLVVSASRLVKRKGQDILLDAWPEVLRHIPSARLLIIGGGPNAGKLNKKIQNLHLESSVTMTGIVPSIPPYIDAASLFIMPCRSRHFGLEAEGLGIVFLEASACGKPVIVGNSGGAPDAVDNGVTGYLVDPHDRKEIASRVIELLADPKKAREMGKKGRERIMNGWQWNHIYADCRRFLNLDV